MIRIFDIATGELTPNNPPRISVYRVVVKHPECGHLTDTVAPSQLDAFLESHDVQDFWREEILDPEYVRERRDAFRKAWDSSCIMPPTEDLLLLKAAKETAPEDWETIDPDHGIWKETRTKLAQIRASKHYSTPTP